VLCLIGGAATAMAPLGWAQGERVRKVGVLLPANADDAEYRDLFGAFVAEMQSAGWINGRTARIEVRWAGAGSDGLRKAAGDLVATEPDVIMGAGAASADPLLRATRKIPVVFVVVPDPVGAGFVDSLARPGGNATGFTSFEYGIGAKWLELLREIAPATSRVAVARDPTITAGIGQWSAIQTAASGFRIETVPVNLRDGDAIEGQIAEFARSPNGGLIVTSSALSIRHRDLFVRLAAQHKLPAIYYGRAFAEAGGLIAYGPDRIEQFKRAANYVDRILRGEKIANLPVQAPTKYELVVNNKAAAALGLTIPLALLARADTVIE